MRRGPCQARWVLANREELDLRSPSFDVEGEEALTDEAALREAVRWLYSEKIYPRAVLVQWRLESRSHVKWAKNRLQAVAQAASGLYVMPHEPVKFNYSIMLREEHYDNPNGLFADDDDSAKEVDDAVWNEVVRYLKAGAWPYCRDAGYQLYELAVWLQGQSQTLAKVDVGTLLGLARRGTRCQLLGYRGQALVPFCHSDDYEKAENAKAHRPTGIKEGELYAKEWKHLQWCFVQVLGRHGGSLQVPALKTKFRDLHEAELSETAFGHVTLMGLLRDEKLGTAFTIDPQTGKESSTQVITLLDYSMVDRPFSGQGFGTVPPKGYEFLLSAVSPLQLQEATLSDAGSAVEGTDSDSMASGRPLELVQTPPRKRRGSCSHTDMDTMEVTPEGEWGSFGSDFGDPPTGRAGTDDVQVEQVSSPCTGDRLSFSPASSHSSHGVDAPVQRMGYTPEVVQRMSQDERFTALDQLLQTDEEFIDDMKRQLTLCLESIGTIKQTKERKVKQTGPAEARKQALPRALPLKKAEHNKITGSKETNGSEQCDHPWRLCIRRTFVNVELGLQTPTVRARSSPPHGDRRESVWPCLGWADMDSTMDTATATARMHNAE